MTTKTPRGIRNGNPGNLRRSGIRWIGLAKVQSDPEFCVFTDAYFGLRACARVLLTYQRAHGLRTVRTIIARYAPPVENETSFYIVAVAKKLGVHMDKLIDLTDVDTLAAFVTSIVKHENGQQPYSAELIRSACLSALGRKA